MALGASETDISAMSKPPIEFALAATICSPGPLQDCDDNYCVGQGLSIDDKDTTLGLAIAPQASYLRN